MRRMNRIGGRSGVRPKGLEDLHVYSISRNKRLRSDRILIGTVRFLCLKQDGQDAQDAQDEGFLRSIQSCTGHD